MRAIFFGNVTGFFIIGHYRLPYDMPALMTQRSHWNIVPAKPPIKKYLPYLENK